VSRYRSTQLGRWAQALGVAVAYVAVTATLLSFDVLDFGLTLPWAVIAVPPFFYAVVSRVLWRRASRNRRLSWIGGACLAHVTLGVAVSVVVGILDTLTPLSALAHVFVRLGPGPFLTLVATPLVLASLRGRVLASRPAPRAERARQPVVFTPPTPGQTPFAREPRRREVTPEPVAPPAAEVPVAPPELPPDDGSVVRVRFERVANQLPAKAFTLPLDRVAESLREPHWLTVPRRVVVALLPEGAVQVDWAIVASQFPPLAFSVTDVEFRRQYPDLKLTLPSASITAHRCCMQMSGMARLSVVFAPRCATRTISRSTSPGRMRCARINSSSESSGAWIGEPTAQRLMSAFMIS